MAGFWITIILMVLTGVLACAGMIAAKQPNAGAAIAKLVPFQGIIGVLALIWGVWSLVENLSALIDAISLVPVRAILAIASSVLLILLGFLFAWSLIARVAGGRASGGAATAQAKLAGIQGPLGVITLIVAALLVIFVLFNVAI